MPTDRFLIAPFSSGWQTNLKPWLIPADAFAQLRNAYVYRGRIRKRFGGTYMGNTQLTSRLRINIGTTDGGGTLVTIVPGNVFEIGQMFSVGSEVFTVYQSGNPADMHRSIGAIPASYSTTTGSVTIVGAQALTDVYFYPAQPVMGLTLYQVGPINNQPTYGFDTQFAYSFVTGAGWQRAGTAEWNGTNSQFFWATNWRGTFSNLTYLFVTNFNATIGVPGANDDPIRYWDGTAWGDLVPYYDPNGGAVGTGPFVATAKIIVAFRNRLVLLNTIENDGSESPGINAAYVNRARWCFYGSPFADNAWYQGNSADSTGGAGHVGAGGGFEDASTKEAIISAQFIKDRLIVFFERGTWELVYTGNELQPFIWQKLNTELGSQSLLSTVPFDRDIFTVGATGIHACNGSNVERIDDKIPDQVFKVRQTNQGANRINGIRDYYAEVVYWTFPNNDANPDQIFPNEVILYNYKEGSWALLDDCITVFGYFEQQDDATWETVGDLTWQQANFTWSSGITEARFRQVIAGNQQGYVFIVNPDVNRNAGVMQITNMAIFDGNSVDLTIINHTLQVGEFIAVENAVGVTGINDGSYLIEEIIDEDTVRILAQFGGAYLGGGVATRVSNYYILSKQWNPYVNSDRSFYLSKIDFIVERTSDGEVTIDYYPNDTTLSMIQQGQISGSILGTNVLETRPYPVALAPLEQLQDRLAHPVYFQSWGEFIQILITMYPDQLGQLPVAWSPFVLEGLVVYAQPASARLE